MNRTKKIVFIALFIALITIGAFIKIPTPLVPVTLQLSICMLAGLLLGPLGAVAVIIYIALGLLGLPVFAYGGGLFYIFKPSFGYLIGFAVATLIVGILTKAHKKPSFKLNFFASLLGLVVIYIIGVSYMIIIYKFYLNTAMNIKNIIIYGCLIFLPSDIIFCTTISFIATRLSPYLRNNNI